MYYKFDKNELKYVRVNWVSMGLKVLIGVLVTSMILGWSFKPEAKENYTEEEVMIFTAKQNLFSNEKLINEIKGLNFKFPHIVYAQSLLETGKFTSPLFKENHNLFGMKEAVIRLTTSLGTEDGHAIYKTWKESLTDYALYCATYLSNLDNEDDYIGYLSQKYARDPDYGKKLRELIKKENLKGIFK
jgi:hypothetical protein